VFPDEKRLDAAYVRKTGLLRLFDIAKRRACGGNAGLHAAATEALERGNLKVVEQCPQGRGDVERPVVAGIDRLRVLTKQRRKTGARLMFPGQYDLAGRKPRKERVELGEIVTSRDLGHEEIAC